MQWATTMAVAALFAVSACSSEYGPTDAERAADRDYEQFVDEQRRRDWLAQQEQEHREYDEEQRAGEAERERAGRDAQVEWYREKYQEIEYYAELDGYIDEFEQRALDGTNLPEWTYYIETLPEECFRTEREARNAGYRASRVR